MKNNRALYISIALVVIYFALPIIPLIPLTLMCNAVKSKQLFNAAGVFFLPVDYLDRHGPTWLKRFYDSQGRLAEKIIKLDTSY